ncbi:MAG: SLC13/DASS family transporter [Acidobacteria bacterium]|nr:SLC13/DASS family transporter [Acidobacteriota bacterium]
MLFAGALIYPAPEGMSLEAKRTAAVVLLMAVWWITEAVEMAITSLLPLVLFPVLGILPSEKVAPYYTDHVIFLYFGGFVVALAIQKWNLHRRIALHTIRMVGTEPTKLVLGFMIATAFLSMWMSNTACAMMMFPIGIAVVLQLAGEEGQPPDRRILDNFGSVLMLSIAYASSLGGIGTLIGTPTNLVFAGAATKLVPGGPEIQFLKWMAIGVPVVIIFLPICWFYLCRYSSPVPLSQIKFRSGQHVIEDELRKMGRITREEMLLLVVWAFMALLWIFRSPLNLGSFTIPGWSQLFAKRAFLHDATVAMAAGILLCLIPSSKMKGGENGGKPERVYLIDWDTIRKGVPWGVLFLFGGGFALAAGMEATGLSAWLGTIFGKLAGIPPFLIVLIVCLGVTFLSEIASNTATAVMAMPILAATAGQVGLHPYLIMIAGTIAASYGFMLPVATPPNAIVYSSGWIPAPQMAKTGLALDLMGVLLVAAMVYLLVGPVFGIPV